MPILFPDNPMRDARYRELLSDINHQLNQLKEHTATFQAELATASGLLKQKFGQLSELVGDVPLKLEEREVGDISLPLAIASVIGSAAVGAAVSRGIQVALLKGGGARAAWAAEKLFGRLAFTRGGVLKGAGGMGAAALIALLIEGVGEAISGAVTRDELRRGIGELLEPRVHAFRAAHTMSIAARGISAIARAVDALPAGTPAAEVQAAIQRAYARDREQIEAMTVQLAAAHLSVLDRERNSYQVDDTMIAQADNLGFINEARAEQALDVPGESHREAELLIVYPWHGRRNQRWDLSTLERDNQRGWGVRNQESNLWLNAAAPGGHANGDVIQWWGGVNDNSMWLFVPVPLLAEQHQNERRVMIVSKMTGDALEADDTGRVVLRPPTGQTAQLWRFRV